MPIRCTRRSFLKLSAFLLFSACFTRAFPGLSPGKTRKLDSWLQTSDSEEVFLSDRMYAKQIVRYRNPEHIGALVVDTMNYLLYQVRRDGYAVRYGVGVGREGYLWQGNARIMKKVKWPGWTPPQEMRKRQPYLPRTMPGGKKNPMGARALYLYQGKVDTLYRIHGTIEPESIGTQVSSGCIRMLNEHIVDLYARTPVGTRVIVI